METLTVNSQKGIKILLSIEKKVDTLRDSIDSLKNNPQPIPQKRVNIDVASEVTGYSISTLYRLTHEKAIPHYKTRGGKLHFIVSELNDWLESGGIAKLTSATKSKK